MVSSGIRGYINIEPKLVNNVKYSLINVRKKDCLKFIERNGYYVRNLEIKGYWRIGTEINFNQLPRLKELSIQSMRFGNNELNIEECNGLNLSNLRCLRTYNMTDLQDLIRMLKNTRNLTKFEAKFNNNENHEMWMNFIFQQVNLEELNLHIVTDPYNFPYRDVQKLIKFKLRSLRMSLSRVDQNLLLSFLNTQGSSLKSLDFQVTDEVIFPSRDISNEIKFNPTKLKLFILNPHPTNFQTFIESQAIRLEELDLEIESDPPNFLQRQFSTLETLRLTKLKLCLKNVNHENLLNLLSRAHFLKELELSISDMDLDKFPCREIKNEMNFRLKKFKFSLPDINEERFVNFLAVQAESLEELEVNSIKNFDNLVTIFNNLQNIKKLTIDTDASNLIFGNEPKFCLETLQYFMDKNQNGTIVTKLFKIFPNIETLKVCDTMQAKGIYPKVTTLDVSVVYWARIRNLNLPNLKNLFIKKVDKINDEYYWTHFTHNFKNVENIAVHSIGYEDKDVFRFVKRLKVFQKLKTFKIRHGMAIDHDYDMDENERVAVREKFFKILIDTTKRTIRVSTYIAKNRLDIMKILQKTFKKFEFFEFCFEVIKMRKISVTELRRSRRYKIQKKRHSEPE